MELYAINGGGAEGLTVYSSLGGNDGNDCWSREVFLCWVRGGCEAVGPAPGWDADAVDDDCEVLHFCPAEEVGGTALVVRARALLENHSFTKTPAFRSTRCTRVFPRETPALSMSEAGSVTGLPAGTNGIWAPKRGKDLVLLI